MIARYRRVIQGFGITLGMTLLWLSLIVLIPLAALFLKTTELSLDQFLRIVTGPRVAHALQLSFGLSLAAAAVNLLFGSAVVWALVRYEFPGRRVFHAIVDIPFALPTAVAGIALTNLYAENGWLGPLLAPLGIQVAFTPLGICVALVFVGLPFVVRTVQPVLEDLEAEEEEAAATLGATRWQTFRRVVFPYVTPALLTGFALAFARALGEYGSVVFISGNMPGQTEIAPLLIVTKLQQFDYPGAAVIAVVTLLASFAVLLVVNLLERWSRQRYSSVG